MVEDRPGKRSERDLPGRENRLAWGNTSHPGWRSPADRFRGDRADDEGRPMPAGSGSGSEYALDFSCG